jgi:hypothetical protein
MRLSLNDQRTCLQIGPVTIALRRHVILSMICWMICLWNVGARRSVYRY